MNQLKSLCLGVALGALMLLPVASHAKTIICNSTSDCKAKILASRNTEGKDAGAVCFAPNVEKVPKPTEGWPSECKAEFKCSSDKKLVVRTYHKDISFYQQWIKSSGSSGGGARLSSCLWSDQMYKTCGQFAGAFGSALTNTYWQLARLMGTGADDYSAKMNPPDFCAKGKGTVEYYYKVYASPRITSLTWSATGWSPNGKS